jgi:glycosyltransferase involved in cell wall biosynthesis
MLKQSNWLILSHGFNMDGRAASQTITDKIPFLINEGIYPVVISAVTGSKDKIIPHYQTLPFAGAGLRFDLRHYLKYRIKNKVIYKILMGVITLTLLPLIGLEKLFFGLQSQASWSLTALIRSLWLIKKYDINLIYSTGGAYSAHLTALWLKKITNLPWIAEIHDPMIQPGTIPQTRDQKFQASLEKNVCQNGDLIWWFTQGALLSSQMRCPELKDKGIVIIPGATPPDIKGTYLKSKFFNISHFGSLSETRSLAPFLKALSSCIQSGSIPKDILKVHIYGGKIDRMSKALIKKLQLEDSVIEHGRLEFNPVNNLSGREQVVLKMQESDCLLLMHGEIPECSEYIPSKLYEYFWAERPVLGITHNNTQLDDLIRQRNCFVAHTSNPDSIIKELEKIYQLWTTNQLLTKSNPISVEQAVKEIINHCKTRNLIK